MGIINACRTFVIRSNRTAISHHFIESTWLDVTLLYHLSRVNTQYTSSCSIYRDISGQQPKINLTVTDSFYNVILFKVCNHNSITFLVMTDIFRLCKVCSDFYDVCMDFQSLSAEGNNVIAGEICSGKTLMDSWHLGSVSVRSYMRMDTTFNLKAQIIGLHVHLIYNTSTFINSFFFF